MNRRSMRAARILLAAVAISLTAACSLDPTRLPVPGAYTPHHPYRIKIEFSSVLNLPARAKEHWGWNWSDAKAALEWLFLSGEVMAAGRTNGFARL